MSHPMPLPHHTSTDGRKPRAKEATTHRRPPQLHAIHAGDDDGWEDTFDREGHQTGQINMTTGAFRPRPDQTPEEAAAESLLPEPMRPTITLANGQQVDALTYHALKNLHQTTQAHLVTRNIARAGTRARHDGKPLAPVWIGRDDWAHDRRQGQELRQATSDTLAHLTLMHQQRQALFSQITTGPVEGTAAPYQDAQEAKERERRLFDVSISPDERAKEHDVRMETLRGQQRLEEKRVDAEVAFTMNERNQQHEEVIELLASRKEIQATIFELDSIHTQDTTGYLTRLIGGLLLLDSTLGEYVGGTPEQRESGRKRLIQQNAPALWNEVQGVMQAQVRQARPAARKPPDQPSRDDKAAS